MSLPAQKDKPAACIAVLTVVTPLAVLSSRTVVLRAVRARLEGTWWDSTGSSRRRILEWKGGEMLES